MNHPFYVSEERLLSIRATQQGRISLGGFNYQAGFAISRMAAMVARCQSLNLEGVPTALRYDWGEDIDERCRDSIVYFNQCKKVSDIGRPVSMAGVLLGFAPKLLWASVDNRTRVRFRLVCTDQRFLIGGHLGNSISNSRDAVRSHFFERLSNSSNGRSDCAIWQDAADAFGHEALFNALWDQTEAVFLSDAVHYDHPAGPILEAEREALRILLESPAIGIDTERQRDTIARLRSVLHENLIEFNPASKETVDLGGRTPRQLRRADVATELFEYRRHEGQRLPFQVVSRVFLQDQRAKAKREFVARPPDWSDVVHGTDDTVKFVERDQTEDLRQAVMDELVETVSRGTDQRLPVKFVVGPPGSGKSTIVRRVVATLVQEGHVVAADAGVYVENPGDPGRLCDKLDDLARQGKPVLLVLDDPLYADSDWPTVLRKLATPGSGIAVLAPSPTFLYERYHAKLGGRVHKTKFHITSPSDAERRELDRLYKYASSEPAQAEVDFLTLVMQHAADDSFDGIIYRLWETLNNGRPISPDTEFEEYPWAVRAFLVTCFFHRTYEPCPEPILRAVLERSGGIASGRSVTDALQQLTYQDGWAVFRIKAPQVHPRFSFVGDQISAAHHRIAERAWQLRPAPWRTLNHLIVQATLDAPEGIRAVGNAAAALGQAGDDSLSNELVDTWKSTEVETRFVYDVYIALHRGGCFRPAAKLIDSLKTRAVETRDGWMAALGLWIGSASVDHKREFPPAVNLISLIGVADFSIAPGRAIRFAKCLQSSEMAAFRKRLFECLDGRFNWTLESLLLTWLLANSPVAETRTNYRKITEWLDCHPEDTSVRTQYLAYLMRLPAAEFEEERRHAAQNTAQWLNEHPEDTSVRTQYLTYLMKLPAAEFEEERRQAAQITAQWLDEHPEDASVRTQYLTYLMKLRAAEFEEERRQAAQITAQWLDEHPEDTSVRTQYLTYLMKLPAAEFEEERRQAAQITAQWLDEHPEDASVRTQYQTYLMKLRAAEFEEERREAAQNTAQWLNEHPEDASVRTQYLTYLMKLPAAEFEEERRQVAQNTAQWLDEHREDTTVLTQYLTYLMKLPAAEFEEERRQAAQNTEQWLNEHRDDTTVRTQYLTYLMKLPAAEFEEERRQAAKNTAQWLEEHRDDTNVRTQYLTYLMKLPAAEFEEERRQAAQNTALWLDDHRDDTTVRTAWLAYMLRKNIDTPHLWNQVEQNCLKLISLLPGSASGYNAYGRFLMESERFAEATLQFKKALKIHKGFHMARWGLASALWKSGEYRKAECEFKTALSWAQKNGVSKVPMIYSSLGWLYVDCGRWQDAMTAFESARKLVPAYFANLWGIGRVQFELGDFQKAVELLRQALNTPNLQPPASDEIPALLAECLTRLKK